MAAITGAINRVYTAALATASTKPMRQSRIPSQPIVETHIREAYRAIQIWRRT